jgi:predicted secreted protein
MATLKGKNFRILTYDTTASKYKVVGMATSCTVTHQSNTENANHKDIVGIAQLPTVVSQSCNISVESLSVADVGAMLTAIKSLTPFTLIWDETSTTDNQTALGATFARRGQFFLNDCTFQFDNRTNSTKSLQFSSTGAIEVLDTTPTVETITTGAFTKGENVRLFLGSDNTATPSRVVAGARTLSVHCSLTLEDATTKDTDGNWTVQEATELAWDISSGALVRSGDNITSSVQAQGLAEIEAIKEAGNPVKCFVANTSGANNRTLGAIILSGSVIVSQLTINGPLGTADYTTQLNGYGPYTVGA